VRKRTIALLAVTFAFGGSGCQHPAAKDGTTKAQAADKDEWVELPPATGSWIPRRVRRSELANAQAASDNANNQAVVTVSGPLAGMGYSPQPVVAPGSR
jgi:hypothetical protein